MGFTHPQGLIAVLIAIVCFYGTTYAVIALNLGWRFGYWVAGSTFGALMFMLSIFWMVNPVGPRGNDAAWVPLAAARDTITAATFKAKPLSAPASYPGPPWTKPDDVARENDLSTGVVTCVTTAPEQLPAASQAVCRDAQSLMPPENTIPVINGSPVAITAEVRDVKFAREQGQLGEATIVPTTHDPRVAKDPKAGKQMGPSFKMLFIYDEGSVREPPAFSAGIFLLFFLFHLWGLNRAEKRKLNPAVV